LYDHRKETIELLFQRIIQVLSLKECQVKGAERFGSLLLLDTFRYCRRVSVFYIQCYYPIGGSL